MRSYNPLSVDELGRNAARALMKYPPCDLPPPDQIDGCGVYAIHYRGSFPAYANMTGDEPIYVGKAEPEGRRQGRARAGPIKPALRNRLAKHAQSIEFACNLRLEDFQCRWLELDPIWIGLTERMLIGEYRPIWNVVVNGFGNNPPGKGRSNQRRSQWDTLHPGRQWASSLPDCPETLGDILEKIREHRRGRNGP